MAKNSPTPVTCSFILADNSIGPFLQIKLECHSLHTRPRHGHELLRRVGELCIVPLWALNIGLVGALRSSHPIDSILLAWSGITDPPG